MPLVIMATHYSVMNKHGYLFYNRALASYSANKNIFIMYTTNNTHIIWNLRQGTKDMLSHGRTAISKARTVHVMSTQLAMVS